MKGPPSSAPAFGPPPRQHNLLQAAEKAVELLRRQAREQLEWLGAVGWRGEAWRLRVLNDELDVDLAAGRVTTPAGVEAGPQWRVLVLHYLCVTDRPADEPPEITFGDLPGGRAYAEVYRQRVNERLCVTAGRTAASLQAAAEALGGLRAQGGDLAFDLRPFPRLPLRLIWHAGDEEFGPSATLLLPRNIEGFMPLEDVVVLSERVVSRLGGRPF